MESKIYQASKEFQLHFFGLNEFGMTKELKTKQKLGPCRICQKYTDTSCIASSLFPGETLYLCEFCFEDTKNEVQKPSFILKLRKNLLSDEINVCKYCNSKDRWVWTGMQELSGPLPRRIIECLCGEGSTRTYFLETNLPYINSKAPLHVYLREGEVFNSSVDDALTVFCYITAALGCDCKNTMDIYSFGNQSWTLSYLPNSYVRMKRKKYGQFIDLIFAKSIHRKPISPVKSSLFVAIRMLLLQNPNM